MPCISLLCGGNFYPRSPCGERPNRPRCTRPAKHFYPRSPCGERPYRVCLSHQFLQISIHALLAESDLLALKSSETLFLFLSTLSLRRATALSSNVSMPSGFLSTLSLRRATTPATRASIGRLISIHALLAESDRAL